MKEQVTGQNGINLNYEIKKMTVKPNDLIFIRTNEELSFDVMLNLSNEMKRIYPNNQIVIMPKDTIDISTTRLETILDELTDVLNQRRNESFAVDVEEFDF